MAAELLIDPNIAYLLLVSGLALALLALLSPGTGLLELAGLALLIAAGWGVYNLPLNLWAMGALLLGGVAFLLSVRRASGPIFLAASILLLVAGSAFLFRGEGWQPAVHPVLALLVSTLTAGFFWVVAKKTLEAELARPTHDLTTLIGARGETRTPVHQEGTVQVAGELWSAHSREPIPAETGVRVIGRDGFTLEVELLQPTQTNP